ncbi:MAG: alpha/beta hydrolase, partial [Pseudomonadota bacterium]
STHGTYNVPTLRLDDGAQLAYREVGQGPAVVLLHGWGVAGACFEPLTQALGEQWHVVVPDLRGHGASSPLAPDQGFETLVSDLHQLLRALDLRRAVVVGWSMGAMLSWALADEDSDERVAGLCTIDMVPRLLNDEGWRYGLRNGRDSSVYGEVARRMVESWPDFMRIFVPRIVARHSLTKHRALCEWLIDMGAANDPSSMARLWLSMVEQDLCDALGRIERPALVVYGEHSQLYNGAANQWVVGQMPRAISCPFADSGHAPHLEEAERFRLELLVFMASLYDHNA